MSATATKTVTHDGIVVGLVGYCKGKGWVVDTAALPGYTEPPKIGRHEPDMTGRNQGGVVIIGEAKTGEGDLGTAHSREQYQDFSSREMVKTKTPCPFYVCVPKEHKAELERVLAEEGVLNKPNVEVLVYG